MWHRNDSSRVNITAAVICLHYFCKHSSGLWSVIIDPNSDIRVISVHVYASIYTCVFDNFGRAINTRDGSPQHQTQVLIQ
jgi:hypothetical protein